MTRPWGKQYAHMLNHPKYLRASVEARSAWHTLFLVALNGPGEDALGTRTDVEAILRNYGHGDQAAARLDELIRLRLVDVRRNFLRLHDWKDWQPDDPTGAKRKKAARHARNVRGQSADVPSDSPETVRGHSAERHALDIDREEITPPNPPLPGGRRRGRNGDERTYASGRLRSPSDYGAVVVTDDDLDLTLEEAAP